MWTPLHDEENEGEWRDIYNHQVSNFTPPWGKGEPNGGINENCANVLDSGIWWDVPCSGPWLGPFCLCQRKPYFYMRLRGLCVNSAIDKYYHPMNDFSDYARLQIVGDSASAIEYDQNSKHWKLSSAISSNISGLSRADHNTFLLGKHRWSIKGDSGCNGGEYTGPLKLTGCNATGQFTCDDGQCVSMEQRCNQLPECRDNSDENNCSVLVLSEGYNKNVPPISVNNGIKKMVNMYVSIELSKVVDIDEVDYSVEMQISITLRWTENRAKYQNLKKDRSLNALTQEDLQLLWLPEMIYENTDQKESTRLGENWEWKTNVVVERNTSGTPAGLEVADETQLFLGGENNLTMFQTYTHEFQCIFDLKKYPFDTQTCSINMVIGLLDRTSVSLIPDQLRMEQSPDMPIFKMIDWKFIHRTQTDGTKTLAMIMVLKRKVTSELMTTYFPTLLLTAITFATTFFKPFFFEAALSVNLTTMLVMTTIFISKMESLPPTSDIKMIDIWLVLCQIYPFVEVVLLTAMEYRREGGNEKRKTRKKKRKSDVQIVNSMSISVMDNYEKPKTKWEEFAEIVSSWKAPGLKTLGRLLTSFGL